MIIVDSRHTGIDDPEKLLTSIQEKITCKLLDKESDPVLHALVARYQMHKCSALLQAKSQAWWCLHYFMQIQFSQKAM